MADKEKKQEPILNVEPWHTKFKEWSLQQEKNRTITLITIGLVISAVIIAGVTLIPVIPSWAYPFLTFPIGIFLFLAGLHLSFKYEESKEDYVPLKTKWSFKKRLKMFSLFAVIFIAFVLGIRNYIPEALGGSITIAMLLTFYNAVRRSPEELQLDAAGIADPRDVVEYVDEKDHLFAPDEEYDEEYLNDSVEEGR